MKRTRGCAEEEGRKRGRQWRGRADAIMRKRVKWLEDDEEGGVGGNGNNYSGQTSPFQDAP